MKKTGIIALSISCAWVIVCSCGQKKKVVVDQEPDAEIVVPVTTGWVFEFSASDIPEGYQMDTISYRDSISMVQVNARYIVEVGKDFSYYNKDVYKGLADEIARNLKGYDLADSKPEQREEYIEEYGPVKFSVTGDYISTQFINDSYSGGVHHNHFWFSINYSRKLKRLVTWEDIFDLKNEADTNALCAVIQRNLKDADPMFEYMDFFIDGDTIEFGPALSWAEGMQSARLPMDSLQPFLKN